MWNVELAGSDHFWHASLNETWYLKTRQIDYIDLQVWTKSVQPFLNGREAKLIKMGKILHFVLKGWPRCGKCGITSLSSATVKSNLGWTMAKLVPM